MTTDCRDARRCVLRTGSVVTMALSLAIAFVASASRVGASSPTTALIAPGTGHGVLGNAPQPPPAAVGSTLQYAPGGYQGGGGCATQGPLRLDVQTLTFGPANTGAPATVGDVGLPVMTCVAGIRARDVVWTITAPQGRAVHIRHQTAFLFEVLPSPPHARELVFAPGGPTFASQAVPGDGAGTYRISARGPTGSMSATLSVRAATPRRLAAFDALSNAWQYLKRGQRVRFTAAGETPLSVFQIGMFGSPNGDPEVASSRAFYSVINARADKRGEAVITLDTLRTGPTGSFVAVLDPMTTTIGPSSGIDPLAFDLVITK